MEENRKKHPVLLVRMTTNTLRTFHNFNKEVIFQTLKWPDKEQLRYYPGVIETAMLKAGVDMDRLKARTGPATFARTVKGFAREISGDCRKARYAVGVAIRNVMMGTCVVALQGRVINDKECSD